MIWIRWLSFSPPRTTYWALITLLWGWGAVPGSFPQNFQHLFLRKCTYWKNATDVNLTVKTPHCAPLFLGSYPYEKPSSKIQSSHVYLSVPWDLTGLGTHPLQPMSPYRSAWYSVWEAVINDGHHSVRLSRHIQSGRDLADNWVSSDTWLPSLIGLWISTCISNVTEHTPHEITNVHSHQCCKGRRLHVSPNSFP